MTRRVGVALQLLAQFDHVRVHSAGVRKGIVAPDGIQNHVARERAIRVLQEVDQQAVFGRREFDLFALALDDAAFEVNFDVLKLQ